MNFGKMTIAELRAECEKRGAKRDGRKKKRPYWKVSCCLNGSKILPFYNQQCQWHDPTEFQKSSDHFVWGRLIISRNLVISTLSSLKILTI